jgi:hypothetical protein
VRPPTLPLGEGPAPAVPPQPSPPTPAPAPAFPGQKVAAVRWKGEIPWQKWTTFYNKVLSRLVGEGGLTLTVEFEARPPGGVGAERVNETRQNLRELELPDSLTVEEEEPGQAS